MSMAIVDRALRGAEMGEEVMAPCQDDEFVLYHSDAVEASGFVQHLKLPHYVDFQADLLFLRRLRMEHAQAQAEARAQAGARAQAQAQAQAQGGAASNQDAMKEAAE